MTILETVHAIPRHARPIASGIHKAVRSVPPVLYHEYREYQSSENDRIRAAKSLTDSLDPVCDIQSIEIEELPETADHGLRYVKTALVNYRGESMSLRETTPCLGSNRNEGQALSIKLGFKQSPHEGNGQRFHDSIANKHPDMTVLTLSTPGVGKYEREPKLSDAIRKSFNAMARTDLDIEKQLYGEAPIWDIGYSMGGARVMNKDFLNYMKPVINNVGSVYVMPALVPPLKALKVMGYDFLHDVHKEQYEDAHESFMSTVAMCVKEIRNIQNACVGNAIQLSGGTRRMKMNRVAKSIQLAIIYGTEDSLAKPEMYKELERKYPGQVKLVPKIGVGHFIHDRLPEIADDIANITSGSDSYKPIAV